MPLPPRPHPCLHSHYCCSLRQHHCTSDAPVDGWLLCPLSLFACCLVRRPNLSAPPRCAVVSVNDDCYRRRPRLPSPLPQSTTMTAKSQQLSFIVDGGNDDRHQLQRRLMAAAAMTSLPPPSTTTTGWWLIVRCCCHHRRHLRCCRHHARIVRSHCRHRQCRRHHTLTLASTLTIAAASTNVTALPALLLMVGCCVICRSLPAALSAI